MIVDRKEKSTNIASISRRKMRAKVEIGDQLRRWRRRRRRSRRSRRKRRRRRRRRRRQMEIGMQLHGIWEKVASDG